MAGFAHSKAIERRYAAQLAKVAKEVGKLAARFADDVPGLVRALKEYAAKLEPWAADVATRFIGEVDKANARAWAEKSTAIAKALKGDVAKSAIGLAAQERHFAQVTLITSLPLEAAARAQKLAEDAARGGKRAGDVREAILETEKVTASRAQLIARTEIAKANAALTQARAQMAGMTHYVWETMQDEDVREEHAILQGRIFSWDNPPEIEGEGAHHPGEIWNCRCFATPVTIEPTATLELIAPGTTIEQRAAEVATAITRSVAARKAAATRAAKKAETAASRAIAAREAKAVAQVEKGAAALQQAAKKAAAAAEKAAAQQVSVDAQLAGHRLVLKKTGERVALTGNTYTHKEAIKAAGGKWNKAAQAWELTPAQAEKLAAQLGTAQAGTVSAINVGEKVAAVAAKAGETTMNTTTKFPAIIGKMGKYTPAEADAMLEEAARRLGGKVWRKGDMARIYINEYRGAGKAFIELDTVPGMGSGLYLRVEGAGMRKHAAEESIRYLLKERGIEA